MSQRDMRVYPMVVEHWLQPIQLRLWSVEWSRTDWGFRRRMLWPLFKP